MWKLQKQSISLNTMVVKCFDLKMVNQLKAVQAKYNRYDYIPLGVGSSNFTMELPVRNHGWNNCSKRGCR